MLLDEVGQEDDEMQGVEGEERGFNGRKRSRFGKSCIIPTVFAIIFAILFVVCLLGVVFLTRRLMMRGSSSSSSFVPASSSSLLSSSSSSSSSSSNSSNSSSSGQSSSSGPPTYFDEFSAEIMGIYVGVRGTHKIFQNPMKVRVFGATNYSIEKFDTDGEALLFRQFSKGNGVRTICEQIGDHGNCVKLSGSGYMAFNVAGGLAYEGESCSEYCDYLIPGLSSQLAARHLDKCDVYWQTDLDDVILQRVVESGTNYPVLEYLKSFSDPHVDAEAYLSFTPGRPTDESGLEPFPGVTVYDLRDHEGDCGDTTFSERTDGAFDKYSEQIRQNKMVREMLHMPLKPVSNVPPSRIRKTHQRGDPVDIPAEFDARKQWSNCTDIIGIITDQGSCGCCWAMSSSAVVSDRLCVLEGVKEQLSSQYMVYCGEHTMGCGGSSSWVDTWDQLLDWGTVSDDCIPFAETDGNCPAKCRNGTTITENMFVYIESVVYPWGNTSESRVEAIQREIMENGPVAAAFYVFSDFYRHEGVYHRSKKATFDGAHAIRIIGWGTTEKGEDYWLVANSWGTDWGEDGLFKIRRGNNECDIEEQVSGALFE